MQAFLFSDCEYYCVSISQITRGGHENSGQHTNVMIIWMISEITEADSYLLLLMVNTWATELIKFIRWKKNVFILVTCRGRILCGWTFDILVAI